MQNYQPQWPTRMIIVAWLIFIVSFFLPATNVVQNGGTRPGTPISGWNAFQMPLAIIANHPIVVIAEPKILLFLLVPFMNFALLMAPVIAFAFRKWAHLLGLLLIPSTAFPVFIPKSLTGDLFIGFYLWFFSSVVMAIGCILLGVSDQLEDRRTARVPADQ